MPENPFHFEPKDTDATQLQRDFITSLTVQRMANVNALADLIGDMNADGLEVFRIIGGKDYKPASRVFTHHRRKNIQVVGESRRSETGSSGCRNPIHGKRAVHEQVVGSRHRHHGRDNHIFYRRLVCSKRRQMMARLMPMLFYSVFIGLGLWVGLMFIDRDPPFHYLGAEYGSKMLPNPVRANEMMSSDWFLSDVKRDCPREVNRIFSNFDTGKVITTLDATPINKTISTDVDHRQESGKDRLSRSFLLPSGLPGRTGYHVETCFYCNVLQVIVPPARICIKSPVLLVNVMQ